MAHFPPPPPNIKQEAPATGDRQHFAFLFAIFCIFFLCFYFLFNGTISKVGVGRYFIGFSTLAAHISIVVAPEKRHKNKANNTIFSCGRR